MAQNPPPQAQQTTPAGDDGPDLTTPETGDTITLTRDELAAVVAEQVATALQGVKPATRPAAGRKQVPVNRHQAPQEATYEPPFIPSPEDFAAANLAASKGELVDEPIAVGATIIAIDTEGVEHTVTPKAFRTIYAGRGWVAHAEDAVRGLAGHGTRKRRRRGGGNIVGADADHEQTASSRRRRTRRPDSD